MEDEQHGGRRSEKGKDEDGKDENGIFNDIVSVSVVLSDRLSGQGQRDIGASGSAGLCGLDLLRALSSGGKSVGGGEPL